jgi:carbon storage regulator
MLVLSRRLNEQIVVNNNVVITVIEIERGKIKLGFEADPGIPIHRMEIHTQLHSDQAAPETPR